MRIRATAKSHYADIDAVVTNVGRTVCDVKLEFAKRKRRAACDPQQGEYVELTYETLPKEEVDLLAILELSR